jgi:gamma-glutamylaminecyclotransferase
MRIFTYGTLMSGEGNHRQLRGARMLAVHRTEPRYALVSLGPYPALLAGGTTSVTGEVYEVDDDLLRALDLFEGAPSLYRRERVCLLGGESVDGYVLARPRAKSYEVIPSGDWREFKCASKS